MAIAKDTYAALAQEIRDKAQTGETVETSLSTNQRIIGRVTDGIYREPWAAFRELIANAYDADAQTVVIETSAPHFDKITVRDDGNGMSPDTLAYVFQNIGGSSKRTQSGPMLHTASAHDPNLSPSGRPLIGKIGIGLFAVAQLTQHFQIITKARGERIRNSATVLLRTHNEQDLSQTDLDTEYVAGNVQIISETVPDDQLDSHGTSIILYSLRAEIRKALQSLRLWSASLEQGIDGNSIVEKPKYHIGVLPGAISEHPGGVGANLPWLPSDSPSDKFRKLVDAAGDVADRAGKPLNLEHFDEYLRSIWKLSLSLPLSYISEHPFDKAGSCGITFLSLPSGKGPSEQLQIGSNCSPRKHFGLEAGLSSGVPPFSVILDNLELMRPIELPNELRKASRVKTPLMMIAKERAPFRADTIERAGGELAFEAYLYWNSKIVPKDTAGVLIRIREASGTLFDTSFLDYQVSEQNRLSQITAEIFVREGLDGAINIDRESFNYSHPHYLYIQRWLHKALRLFVNRQKAIAKEDLDREKAKGQASLTSARAKTAFAIWSSRQGRTQIPRLRDPTLASP
ncbi:MAG: ATP-binding protein [Erythrobacter sp.]|nr:ATP-binding protein [Erythrobacter sp.]MBA4049994.1 ATP-binding protein [Cyanobacteria bacterium DS2.008]MBA4051996.1 ATP-binding protein [Erythrobacter sp.]